MTPTQHAFAIVISLVSLVVIVELVRRRKLREEYALLWIVFLAATWLLREKGHVSVDILYSRLGPGTRRRLDAATYSAAGVACAGVLVLSALYLVDCVRNDVADVRAVTVPKWTVFAVIPLGSLFLTLQLFRSAWERARPAPGERADR